MNIPTPTPVRASSQNSANQVQMDSQFRLLRALVLIVIATSILALVFTGVSGYGFEYLISLGVLLAVSMASLMLLSRGFPLPARVLLPSSLFVVITYLIAVPGYGLHDFIMLMYAVVLGLAGLTLGQRGTYIFSALIILAVSGIGYAELNGIVTSDTSRLTQWYSPIMVAVIILIITIVQRTLINLLNENAERARLGEVEVAKRNADLQAFSEGLEKIIKDRTVQLDLARQISDRRASQFEAIARVTRTISTTHDLEILLAQIPEVINREFGFYHIGIFLLDAAGEYAVLSASNSSGGRRMLANAHRLKVGEVGIVGYVTAVGRARVALDTGSDAVYFNNPDLPETHSEIALPLLLGERVIGALDVQSDQPNAFDQTDIQILSTLADQVGIAIQNARQHEETRMALTESESLSRQFVEAGWSRFSKTRAMEGIHHTGVRSKILYRRPGNDNTESPDDAVTLKPRGRGAVLSLPVKLRGAVIGSVDVRSPENRRWTDDELDIVGAIIERAAIAMENARLLEDSQILATKERTISEISARISGQSEVDDLLKIAVQELGRNLPGMDVSIQLIRDQETGNV